MACKRKTQFANVENTKALGIPPEARTFSDVTLILDSGEIDLVNVSAPPIIHYFWAKEALTRGIKVVLEKPMGLTMDKGDELMALATSLSLLQLVYQSRFYDSDFVTIKS